MVLTGEAQRRRRLAGFRRAERTGARFSSGTRSWCHKGHPRTKNATIEGLGDGFHRGGAAGHGVGGGGSPAMRFLGPRRLRMAVGEARATTGDAPRMKNWAEVDGGCGNRPRSGGGRKNRGGGFPLHSTRARRKGARRSCACGDGRDGCLVLLL